MSPPHPGSGGKAELAQVRRVDWKTERKTMHVGIGFGRWETLEGRVRAK